MDRGAWWAAVHRVTKQVLLNFNQLLRVSYRDRGTVTSAETEGGPQAPWKHRKVEKPCGGAEELFMMRTNIKNDRMISVRFQGKPFNITVIQAYTPTSNAEEVEVEQFYEDL